MGNAKWLLPNPLRADSQRSYRMKSINSTFTVATIHKRQQLNDFVDRFLKPEPALRAVVGVGSIAFGTMRPDSDIDAVLFWDPIEHYIVPSEFVWVPESNTYHSIFEPDMPKTSIQYDFHHFDLKKWSDPNCKWSDGQCAAFVDSWLVYDRDGSVAQLFADRTTYTDLIRIAHLDQALLDMQLIHGEPTKLWQSLGAAVALDRAQSTYDALVRGLFAYNYHWRPWRIREMTYLLTLPWLPSDFAGRVLSALNGPSADLAGYCQRFAAIRDLGNDLLTQLADESTYGANPIDQAFTRNYNQPGYAHNMDEWNAEHTKVQKERQRKSTNQLGFYH